MIHIGKNISTIISKGISAEKAKIHRGGVKMTKGAETRETSLSVIRSDW